MEPPSRTSSRRRGVMRVRWRSGGCDRARWVCHARSSSTSRTPTASFTMWSMAGRLGSNRWLHANVGAPLRRRHPRNPLAVFRVEMAQAPRLPRRPDCKSGDTQKNLPRSDEPGFDRVAGEQAYWATGLRRSAHRAPPASTPDPARRSSLRSYAPAGTASHRNARCSHPPPDAATSPAHGPMASGGCRTGRGKTRSRRADIRAPNTAATSLTPA